jgi:hypothetical protein
MVQEQLDDYLVAKQKAAARLGLHSGQGLPSNHEIAAAVLEYRRLFSQDSHDLRAKRQTALEAMHLLQQFQPRLTGSVLYGTANTHSEITLHLFCDHPEELAFFLLERNIPYELKERHFVSIDKRYPVYRFVAGGYDIALIVFPHNGLRQAPPDPLNAYKPMCRADVSAVHALLDAP